METPEERTFRHLRRKTFEEIEDSIRQAIRIAPGTGSRPDFTGVVQAAGWTVEEFNEEEGRRTPAKRTKTPEYEQLEYNGSSPTA